MFPKFMFQKDEKSESKFKSVIVQSQVEQDALEGKWEESPAAFGIVSHPNPDEESELQAKKAESKKAEHKEAKVKEAKV